MVTEAPETTTTYYLILTTYYLQTHFSISLRSPTSKLLCHICTW